MSPDEIQQAVDRLDVVTPQQVIQAKVYLAAHASGHTRQMIDEFVAAHDGALGERVIITPDSDFDAIVLRLARWRTLNEAARQAIWSLIGCGAFVPGSEHFDDPVTRVGWELRTGGGANGSSWNFGAATPVPIEIRTTAIPSSLSDGDLYLASLDLDTLDPGVADSLRAAVKCFRHDLFLPAQVMLARAVEGTWVRLAQALIANAPDDPSSGPLSRNLAGQPDFHLLPISAEQAFRQLGQQPLAVRSGVRPQELVDARIWTDAVRQARNAIHLDNEPPLPATWESTAALLMGAVPNLRRLTKIAAAGDGRPT